MSFYYTEDSIFPDTARCFQNTDDSIFQMAFCSLLMMKFCFYDLLFKCSKDHIFIWYLLLTEDSVHVMNWYTLLHWRLNHHDILLSTEDSIIFKYHFTVHWRYYLFKSSGVSHSGVSSSRGVSHSGVSWSQFHPKMDFRNM